MIRWCFNTADDLIQRTGLGGACMVEKSDKAKSRHGVTGQVRITDFLIRLLRGDKIKVADAVSQYDVTIRTVQRDADIIRNILAENRMNLELKHDFKFKDYRLIKGDDWSYEEVLALLKIVIGSRSLSKDRVAQIKAHLLGLLSEEQQSTAKRLIADTWAKYNPVNNDTEVLSRLREFSEYVDNSTVIRFNYHHSVKHNGRFETVDQVGIPLGIYFAEFYFYVVMYIEDRDESQIFRLDRFDEVHRLRSSRGIFPLEKRVDIGTLRNQTYLLPGGKKINYKFRYWAYPQTALDKLPNSRVTHTYPDGSVDIEGADLGAQGALLWVLSQGKNLKVIRPQSLVDLVKANLKATLAFYEDDAE